MILLIYHLFRQDLTMLKEKIEKIEKKVKFEICNIINCFRIRFGRKRDCFAGFK